MKRRAYFAKVRNFSFDLIVLISFFALTGCGTFRTKYHAMDDTGGYSDLKTEGKVWVTRFGGNEETRAKDAWAFSRFRAIEICMERGKPITRILGVENRTRSKDFVHTTYSGSAFNTWRIGGFGESFSEVETLKNPQFDTYFMCCDHVYLLGVSTKDISSDDMKGIAKDLMGAVQVTEVPEKSINSGLLEKADLITRVNSRRITTSLELFDAIDAAHDRSRISIHLIREGKPISVDAKAADFSQDAKREMSSFLRKVCAVPEISKRPACNNLQNE